MLHVLFIFFMLFIAPFIGGMFIGVISLPQYPLFTAGIIVSICGLVMLVVSEWNDVSVFGIICGMALMGAFVSQWICQDTKESSDSISEEVQ